MDIDRGPTFGEAERAHNELTALVHHHREAEHLAENMAGLLRALLPLYDNADLRGQILSAIAAWDAHQWPALDKEHAQ